MKKNILLITIFCAFSFFLRAQDNQLSDKTGMQLQNIAMQIQMDSILSNRLYSDSLFTRSLVATLKTPYSFNFTFDSLRSIQHIVSPDHRFKFFSWQIDLGDGTFRQRGAMQMATDDGQLKLLPFFDQSDFVANVSLGVTDRQHWIGAIYYDIIPIEWNNETIYTMIGFDEYTMGISRKIIEIIRFENGEPVLGGDYFMFPKDPTFPIAPVDRFVIQYKKGSSALVRYNPSTKGIVVSELASTSNDLKDPTTLVPSGNENTFIWQNGRWILR